MKDKLQIGLLVVIAGALIYLAVSRTGSSSASTENGAPATATAATTPSLATPDPNDPNAKLADPMAAAQQAAIDSRPKTTVSFGGTTDYEHDFGNIKQNTENKYTFKFTNTGKEPLIIENAQGSCGCTVPDYPKEPIPPGGSGNINVVYKPGGQEGAQQKQVTVTANTEPKQTILKIKAVVEKDPNAPPPAAVPAGLTPVPAPGH